MTIDNTKVVSLNIFAKEYCGTNKPVYWIHSYPTAKDWVKDDIKHKNILQVKIRQAEWSGIRYYIPIGNIQKFVKAFNENNLK